MTSSTPSVGSRKRKSALLADSPLPLKKSQTTAPIQLRDCAQPPDNTLVHKTNVMTDLFHILP